MFGFLKQYMHWLHTRWPSGVVEKLPEMNEDGSTAVPGLYIVGDLTGIPLLKFSSDTGARAVRTIVGDSGFESRTQRDGVRDLVIIGGGVSGMAAGIEARNRGLDFVLGVGGVRAVFYGGEFSKGEADLHVSDGYGSGR